MVRAQHREPAHRVPRHRRLPPRHHHRHLGRPTAPPRSRRSSTRPPAPATSPGPATSSRCEAREGGVLKRAGHTEAAVDLARLAGLYPAGVLCEIVDDDEDGHGPAARARAVRRRARPADDLHRRPHPLPPPDREARAPRRRGAASPPSGATSRATSYESVLDGEQHLAFVRGAVQGEDERARPGAQRVPHRRRVRLAALRLRRRSSTPRMERIAEEGLGVRRLPPRPRGPRHRHRPQDPRLLAAGAGPRHGRRQPRARPAGRQPRVRHRRADPRRPRHHDDAR